MQRLKYVARRGFTTSAICKSGVETTQKTTTGTPSTFKPYPFSSKVRSQGLPAELIPNVNRPLSRKNAAESGSTEALRKGKGLMPYLRRTLPGPAAHELLSNYFARRGRARLLAGSVLTVKLSQPPYNFSGVLMGVNRKGPDSSILLRNIVRKTGVEMRINLASPTLLGIKVIQRAGARKAVTSKSGASGATSTSSKPLTAKQTAGTRVPRSTSSNTNASASTSPNKPKKRSPAKQDPTPQIEVDERDALMSKRMRRGKLYFLRDYPAKMSAISAGITKRDQ